MSANAQWSEELCFEGMQFPFTIPQVSKFEQKNRTLAINIFEWVGKATRNGDPIPPLRYLRQCSVKKGQTRRIVNILM